MFRVVTLQSQTTQTHQFNSMENTETTAPDLEQLLAEAEERGYRRGLNEKITDIMKSPGEFENNISAESNRSAPPEVLANNRPSIWDL